MFNKVSEFYNSVGSFYNVNTTLENTGGVKKWAEKYAERELNIYQSLSLLNSIIAKNIDDDFSQLDKHGMFVRLPEHILVVGCGGVGSWFLPKFIKLLNDARRKGLVSGNMIKTLTICDGDDIEESNLIRQNFSLRDVGKGKAEVLFKRYNSELKEGTNFGYIDKYILRNSQISLKPIEQREKFVSLEQYVTNLGVTQVNETVLVINLIDNNESRKSLHSAADDYSNNGSGAKFMIIDVANATYNGQLTLTIPSLITSDGSVNTGHNFIYNIGGLNGSYYNLIPENDWLNDKISVFDCSVRDANAIEQLFDVNNLAATVLCSYMNSWLESGKLHHSEIYFGTGKNMFIRPARRLYGIYVDGHTVNRPMYVVRDWTLHIDAQKKVDLFDIRSQKLVGSQLQTFVNKRTASADSPGRLFAHLMNLGLTLRNYKYSVGAQNSFKKQIIDFSKRTDIGEALPENEAKSIYSDYYELVFKGKQKADAANQNIMQELFK